MIPSFDIKRISGKLKSDKRDTGFLFQSLLEKQENREFRIFLTIKDVDIDVTEPPTWQVPGKTSFQVEVQRVLNFGEAVVVQIDDDAITLAVVFNESDLDLPEEIKQIIQNNPSKSNIRYRQIPYATFTNEVLKEYLADKIANSGILTFTRFPS
jgi:hypothetical protein